MTAKLISITPDAEKLIAYCARVSSSNQENPEYSKLLKYCIDHGHWSIFEMAHMVVEINTSRAIAAQILRHRSFSFQEFSQRYAPVQDHPLLVEGRKQSAKNRQSSSEPLEGAEQHEWQLIQEYVYDTCYTAYQQAIDAGVSREQSRLLLPLATPTNMYMAGSIRSWIHYLQLRTGTDTQPEHREIAEEIQKIFMKELRQTSRALGWCT
jgi:thymidylate synthase (FAD)